MMRRWNLVIDISAKICKLCIIMDYYIRSIVMIIKSKFVQCVESTEKVDSLLSHFESEVKAFAEFELNLFASL